MSEIILRLAPEDAARIDALAAAIGHLAAVMAECGAGGIPLPWANERGVASADPRVCPAGVVAPAGLPVSSRSPVDAGPTPAAAASPEVAAVDFSDAESLDWRQRRYTDEQTALLLRMHRSGAARADIVAALCAMPGARPTAGSLYHKMRKMGLVADAAPRRTLPAFASEALDAPQPDKPAPRLVTKGWALQWANQRGLCMDGRLDIAVVDAKARALGLPGFVLDVPARVARV